MKDLNSNLPLAGKSFKPLVATSLALALGVSVLSAQDISSGGSISTGNSASKQNYGVSLGGTSNVTIASNNATVTKAQDATSPYSGLLVASNATIKFNDTQASTLTLAGLASGDYVIQNSGGTLEFAPAVAVTTDSNNKIARITNTKSGAKFAFGNGQSAYTYINGGTASAASVDITGLSLTTNTTLAGNLSVAGQTGAQDKNGGAATGAVVDSTTEAITLKIGDDAQNTKTNTFTLVVTGGNGGSTSSVATNGGNATGLSFKGSNAITLQNTNDAQAIINLGVSAGQGQTQGVTNGANGVATAIEIANGSALLIDNVVIKNLGLVSGDYALKNAGTLTLNANSALAYGAGASAGAGQWPNANGIISSNVSGAKFVLGNTIIQGGTAQNNAGTDITAMHLASDSTLQGSLNVLGQAGASGQNGGNVVGLEIAGTSTITLDQPLNINVVGGVGASQGSATAINVVASGTAIITANPSTIAQLVLTSKDAEKNYTFTAIDNAGTSLALENISVLTGDVLNLDGGDVRNTADIALLNNANAVYNFGTKTNSTLSSATLAANGAARDAIGMYFNQNAEFKGALAQTITAQGAKTAGTAGNVYAIVGGNSSVLTLADSSNISISATAGSIDSVVSGNAYGIYVRNAIDGASDFTIAPSGLTNNGAMNITLSGKDVVAIELSGSNKATLPLNVAIDNVTFNQINAGNDLTLIKNTGYSTLSVGSEAFGSAVGASTVGGNLAIVDNAAGNLTLDGTLSVGGGVSISNPVRMYHAIKGGSYDFGSADFGTTVALLSSMTDDVYGFAIAKNTSVKGNLTFAGLSTTANSKNVYGTYLGSQTAETTVLTLDANTNLTYNNLSASNGRAYALYMKGAQGGASINGNTGNHALNVVANGAGEVSALGLDTITFSGYDNLTLSASSTSGDATAITTTGATTIATQIAIDSLSASNGTAYALKNISGNLIFVENNQNSVAKLHVGSAPAASGAQYAIYQTIDAGYAFGTSTTFNAITGNTPVIQDNGQDATWMMLGAKAKVSGSAVVSSIQAGNGTFAEEVATNGGNAYGLISMNDNAEIIFDANTQGKITFSSIQAGKAGAGVNGQGIKVSGENGDAAGIFVDANSLSISGGASSQKGQIIFSSISESQDGNVYVINNASTTGKVLNLGGYTQIFAGTAAGDAMVNNNVAGAVYSFGSDKSYTNLSIEDGITGIALAQDATLQGNLKAQASQAATVLSIGNATLKANNLAISAQSGNGALSGITSSNDNAVLNLNSGILNIDLSGGNVGSSASVIALSNNNLKVSNGTLRANATAGKGDAYIINNSGTGVLTFDQTASLIAGNSSAQINASKLGYKFGIYSDTQASYNFGTTEFSNIIGAKGSDAVDSNAASKGGDAVGIVLAQSTTFKGTLTQTITGGTGGTGASGMGGDATGIQVVSGKNVTLTLDSATVNLNVYGGMGGNGGNATGIATNGGKLSVAGNGLSFTIGNQNTNKAVGVALNNAVFNGNVTFNSIQSAGDAVGLETTGGSVLNSGTLTFAASSFSSDNNSAVINNTGTLTITKNAHIVAGAKTGSANVGIYNNISGAVYNLGSLNLAVTAGNNGAVAIHSDDVASQFNVAAGNTLDLSIDGMGSGDYFASSKIFGGKVNLNFASGAASNVYLNANGGELASLKAAENTTIYLSGKNKSTRVGLADTINFRSLTISEMQSAYVDPTSASINPDKVYSGANFVVLASRAKANKNTNGFGSSYDVNGSRYSASSQSYNIGGSDRIVVNNANASNGMSRINNTLSIGLSDINESKEKKYVVLAQVSNDYTPILGGGADRLHNVVTFNGLSQDGASTLVQSNVGFDVATLEIQRHDLGTEEQLNLTATNNGEDWSNVGAVYFSDLVARDIKVDQNYADSSIAAVSTNFNLVSANLNSLSKRMGELRNSDNTQGVWGRIFAGQQTSEFGLEQTSVYATFQAGYDYKLALENASNYVGLALSYVYGMSKQASASYFADSSATTRISGNASSTTNGVEVALYNSYVADSGLYSDSIVKFGYFASDLNIPAQSDTYNTNNMSVSVSEEIGYRIKFGGSSEWFIDPQAELAYSYINSGDFTQTLGNGATLKTEQDATSLLRTRVGAAWGYNFDHLAKEKDVKASLYVGTYYAYDYIAGGEVHLTTNNGTQGSYDALKSNGRFVLNVGTDVAFKDNAKVYVDFEKSFGGSMRTDYQLSLGVRYSFGSKDASTSSETGSESSNPAVLKPKSLDDK